MTMSLTSLEPDGAYVKGVLWSTPQFTNFSGS
ncbi:hypothetical protein BN971_03677 [Mycobacterium bohemicum DSM 44277]|uniref:Uncharacterized protein n=1 Tax=Mycobacterium bohemicum DSM 44277 TaxID=1236609 RepID=A0A0U0WDW7_MYCBE|nr:hypothetical protein BN971_03677 [Mycobacterium bohemicum DSM 44277]